MADENRHRSRSWLQRFLRDKHGGATGEGEEPTSTAARALVNRDNKVILDAGGVEDAEQLFQTLLMKTFATNGIKGGQLIADTSAHTGGPWFAIKVQTDTKFHTLTGNLENVANTTSGSAPIIPAGETLYGTFTAIRLHSGQVAAYLSEA